MILPTMMIDATGMIMDNPLMIRLIKDDSQTDRNPAKWRFNDG